MQSIEELNNITRSNYKEFLRKTIRCYQEQKGGIISEINYFVDDDSEYPEFKLTQIENGKRRSITLWDI